MRLPLPSRSELEERYDEIAPAFARVLERVTARLTNLLHDRGLNFALRSRVKTFDSYYEKLIHRSRECGSSTEAPPITDILGVRIVCHFLEDIDTARDIVEEYFHVMETESKGSQYSSREFGYQSIHYLVSLPEELWAADLENVAGAAIAEIQLRTILQDAWAEVEHEILYKAEFTPLDEPLRRKLAALNATLTLSDIMFQELREYQRQLQAALAKRRAEFQQHIETGESPEESNPPEKESSRRNHNASRAANNRDTLDNLLLQALTAHNTGNIEEALAIYGRILSTETPPDIKAVILIHRGMALVSKNDFDGAMGDFEEAHRIEPNNPRPHQLRAAALRAGGRNVEAASEVALSVRLDPYFLDAWILGTRIALDRGDGATAWDYYRHAADLAPDDPRVRQLLGRLR